jgi:GGDEF domain-containing protein
MRELRLWLSLMLVWFFCLYNVERMHAPINLASFVYVLATLVALVVVAMPSLRRVHVAWLLLAPMPLFFAMKAYLGYMIFGSNIPLTVTEIVAIVITILLARKIAHGLDEFLEAVQSSMIRHLEDSSRPFEVGQYDIYREIRRARAHHRPLSLMAISPSGGSVQVTRNELIEQIQRESVGRYVRSQVANLLAQETRESDVITEREGYFVTVLPETDSEDAQRFAQRLKQNSEKQLGLDLRVGMASFPDQEVTFEQLLARAASGMWNGQPEKAIATVPSHALPRGSDRRRATRRPNGNGARANGSGTAAMGDGPGSPNAPAVLSSDTIGS